MSNEEAVAVKRVGWIDLVRFRAAQHERLIKYFVIGCTASALDVFIFFILYNEVGTTSLLAHSISVPTAILYSYFVNSRHNFKTYDHTLLRMILFTIACTIGYGVGYAVIVTVESTGLGANIGKLVSLPIVFVLQYILNSQITFRKMADADR